MYPLEAAIGETGVRVVYRNNGLEQIKHTDLASFIRTLGNQISLDTGYLDPCIIRMARCARNVHIVALDRSQIRTVSFRNTHVFPYRTESYAIPTPTTLFHLTLAPNQQGTGYTLTNTRLFSLADNLVVNDNTPLYIFPFSNVGDDGWVCWGDSDVHQLTYRLENCASDIIASWWRATFNHDVAHGDYTLRTFQALDGATEFPVQDLRRHRSVLTAGQIFERIS